MTDVLRVRVPSKASSAVLGVLGLAALGGLLAAAFGHFPSEVRGALAAGGVALVAINVVVKKRLGYLVEVDATGIRELRANGVDIAWSDHPTCVMTSVRGPRPATPRAAAASALTDLANIQKLEIAASGGRRIVVHTAMSSPLADAVSKYRRVASLVEE